MRKIYIKNELYLERNERNELLKLSDAWENFKTTINESYIFYKRKKIEIGGDRSKIGH